MWWEGSKRLGEDMSRGLEGVGCIHLRGEHCALARGVGGANAPRSPLFPAALSTLGIQASGQICPLLLPISIKHPPTPTLAPQVDPGQGEGQERENCLEKDSTRIQ